MVNGRFYFRQTESNNLIGEYSNQFSTNNVTECSNMLTFSGNFIGSYQSTWFEINENQPITSILEINFKPNTQDRIFTLTWRNSKEVIFMGEGFLVGGILIGNYWDMELENLMRNNSRA